MSAKSEESNNNMSNTEFFELDKALRNTGRSLELFVESEMFTRLYDVMRDLNSQKSGLEKQKIYEEIKREILDAEMNEEEESDDSYAAKFCSCIHRVRIYLSNENESKASHGGLFRFIIVRNKMSKQTCLFTIKLKNNWDSNETTQRIKLNEFWFWWM